MGKHDFKLRRGEDTLLVDEQEGGGLLVQIGYYTTDQNGGTWKFIRLNYAGAKKLRDYLVKAVK